jgi:HEAT repeat protein
MRFMVATLVLAVALNGAAHAAEPPSDEVRRFMGMTKSSDEQIRCYAIYSLGKKREKAVAAVPLFIELLGKDTVKVREHVLVALRDLGKDSRPAVPAIIRILGEDKNPQIGRLAAEAIADISEPDFAVPQIVDWVARMPNATEASLAPRHVAHMIIRDYGEKAFPALETALRDPKRSATVLGLLATMGDDAVPFHTRNVRSRDPAVARIAVEAIAKFGPIAIPGLVDALEHPDPSVRDRASEALLKTGDGGRTVDRNSPHAVLAVGAIIPMTKSKDVAVRRRALIAIVNYGAVDRQEVLLGLADKDAETRNDLCQALGRYGPVASLAVIPLAGRLTDSDHSVRLMAAGALWNIEGRAARVLPTLLAALGNKDPAIRHAAVVLLGHMGQSAEAAAASLEYVGRNDDEEDVRAAAALAHRKIVREPNPQP